MSKLNITEILKEKPIGLKLWSPTFGQCTFCKVDDGNCTRPLVIKNDECDWYLYNDGKYCRNGECTLFPSKSMRDWSKFCWKKGDVLVNKERNCYGIFAGWYKDDYTQVKVKHWMNFRNENNIKYLEENQPLTELMSLATDKDADSYICTLEERFDGKLNHDTLEIEPAKPKHEFKPLDYILVKFMGGNEWVLCQFSHFDKDGCVVLVGGNYTDKEVIPYVGNEKLLGTSCG